MVNIIDYKVCWWTTVATGCSEITTRWRPFGISSLIYSEQRCQTSALRFFGSWDFVPDVILICVCAWACNLRLRRRRQLRLRWRFWVACVEWLGLPLVFLVLGLRFWVLVLVFGFAFARFPFRVRAAFECIEPWKRHDKTKQICMWLVCGTLYICVDICDK